jgi:bacillithiol biosynthesis cysteine-adding enzyme BshC
MLKGTIPFDQYPGLAPLFHDFLRGLPEFFPDPPTIEAAAARGKHLLGTPSRIPAEAFRVRLPEAEAMARDLAAGRAVAVVTGHQVGLFTGPLFTITKAFDAIRAARQLREAGVAAVPVFWALTDDHDLEEIARTARPGKDGPEVIVLEGADRSNRRPVGGVPLPEKVTEALDAFRADARGPEAEEILEAFARRYAPGVSYGEAFIETLFDLVGNDPLLVLDPSAEPLRRAAAEFFLLAARKEKEIREALGAATTRLVSAGKPVTVAFRPDVFPFFSVSGGERRRIEDLAGTVEAVAKGSVWPSTDVLTRPVFKSFLMPVAASVLGASEIAYHAQALALFPLFELAPPVLLPRSHLVLLGPPERRAAEALGIDVPHLLQPVPAAPAPVTPEAEALSRITAGVQKELDSLEPRLRETDPTLVGALETAGRKIAYQVEQLSERIRKAAERKDETAMKRRRRLETMLLPEGTPAERLYPPLVPMLAYGREVLAAIREAAQGGGSATEGAAIVNLGADRPPEMEGAHDG